MHIDLLCLTGALKIGPASGGVQSDPKTKQPMVIERYTLDTGRALLDDDDGAISTLCGYLSVCHEPSPSVERQGLVLASIRFHGSQSCTAVRWA